MDRLPTPQILVDVHENDWLINVVPVAGRQHDDETTLLLYRCTKRTPKLVWIGDRKYRLSGESCDAWERGFIRLPKPGEVAVILKDRRQNREASEESAHQYRNRRERYISLMYQAALSHDRELFVELLGPWEVGNWDDKLAKLDEIAATTKG